MNKESTKESPEEPTNNDAMSKNVKVVDKRFWAQKKQAPEEIGNDAAAFDEKNLHPTYVAELEEKVKKAEQQLMDYIAAYKSNKQEQEAFRQRMEKLKEIEIDDYKVTLFNKFIEVIDDLERALKTSLQFNDFTALQNGIELVLQRMIKLVQSEEITIIKPAEGIFDPKDSEPVGIDFTDNEELDDTISEMVLPGYKYKDRVIRPAKIKVYKTHKEET
jgi:molecular chaperone GrpE